MIDVLGMLRQQDVLSFEVLVELALSDQVVSHRIELFVSFFIETRVKGVYPPTEIIQQHHVLMG